MEHDTQDAQAQLQDNIQRILTTWQRGWHTLDNELLTSAWDASYPHLLYIAEERREPLLNWQAIKDYYRSTTAMMEWFEATFELLQTKILGDTAYALCTGHWRGKSRSREEVSHGTTSVYILLRQQAQGWAVIHYIEAAVNLTYAS